MIRRVIFILFLLPIFSGYSQQITITDSLAKDTKILFKKEQSGFAMIHTSGFGFGYRSGKHLTGYKKRMLEFEFTGIKHPKETKTYNQLFQNTKSYVYGKLNSFYLIHAGWGRQKILNSKPYWGGIELRLFYSGGASIGLLKPVYLYVLHQTSDPNLFLKSIERYDPAKHYSENIFGRAPFHYGIGSIKPVPGIYFKAGLNFEYGAYDESIKALEAGIFVDAFMEPIPLMAYNPDKSVFLSIYLAFHFGKRSN
jgi:hypothetical protein